jgi:TRAP-type mannitol/chloroaromatic compound transport system permease small subunit
MPRAIRAYVRIVERVSRYVGIAAMYMIFGMIGILLWSSISKAFFVPSLWTLEMAQFAMVAYFLLGGAHSLQFGAHVRMDLLYARWSDRKKAVVDAITVLFLLFYLVMLLYGGLSSSEYALAYGERSYSTWRPYMAPVKIVMVIGIVLMLLQAIATFIRDFAAARGEPLP